MYPDGEKFLEDSFPDRVKMRCFGVWSGSLGEMIWWIALHIVMRFEDLVVALSRGMPILRITVGVEQYFVCS